LMETTKVVSVSASWALVLACRAILKNLEVENDKESIWYLVWFLCSLESFCGGSYVVQFRIRGCNGPIGPKYKFLWSLWNLGIS
jgi:hypothetical protein